MREPFLAHSKSSTVKARALRRRMTPAESVLWSLVRNNRLGVHFRRQVPFGPYVLDFLCLSVMLAVELDGPQHFRPDALEYDRERDEYLRAHELTVMRFTNKEMLQNSNGVMCEIRRHIRATQRPSP